MFRQMRDSEKSSVWVVPALQVPPAQNSCMWKWHVLGWQLLNTSIYLSLPRVPHLENDYWINDLKSPSSSKINI